MGKLTVLALRIVIAMVLAGSLFVQVRMVPLVSADLIEAGAPEGPRIALLAIIVLAIVCVQVTAVCVWRLLTMVRRDTVFSHGAFRYVDIIFGAIAFAALLMFGIAVILAPGETAPGIVLLICGAAVRRRPLLVRRGHQAPSAGGRRAGIRAPRRGPGGW